MFSYKHPRDKEQTPPKLTVKPAGAQWMLPQRSEARADLRLRRQDRRTVNCLPVR